MRYDQKTTRIIEKAYACLYCLGGRLDGTSTCARKYIERQEAHMLSSRVLFGMFGDNINNPYRENDLASAFAAVEEMEKLADKIYPDRNGFLSNEEKVNI